LLAKYAAALAAPAIVLSVWQILSHGHVAPLVLALDTIAGAVMPFGVLSLVLAYTAGEGEPPSSGADGDPGDEPPGDPDLPSGGLEIDWERFEADVQRYADARRVCV
jgi:hypothetical protein